MLLGLCDRFSKLPSEIEAEGSDLIRMVRVQDRGNPPRGGEWGG